MPSRPRPSPRCTPLLLLTLVCLWAVPTNAFFRRLDQPVPEFSRLHNITLSMGCPEFLSSFYEANATSTLPYRTFSIIKGSGYGYVALHFAKLWVPTGGSIILRAVEGFTKPDILLNLTDLFPSGSLYENIYAPPVLAKEIRIEFYRNVGPSAPGSKQTVAVAGRGDTRQDPVNDRHCYGFVVDWYNYVLVDNQRNITPSNEATCADDNSVEAVCAYDEASTRTAYLAGRAVARLLIQKNNGQTAACTGWLLGSEGHLITNYHCINTQNQASSTTVEFMAEGSVCTQSCMGWGACPGKVEAISTTLVRANEQLDYALVKLQTNVDLPKKYGYLRLKMTQGRVGQEIYIPQHPLYYGKRIAMVNDFGTHTTIQSTSAQGCDVEGYSYDGDTQAGSSGSPVIDALDHGVVALHHCGQYCSNTGIPSVKLIADMQSNGVLPAGAVDPGDNTNTANFPSFQPAEPVAPQPMRTQLTIDGEIHRAGKSLKASVDQIEFSLDVGAQISLDILSAEVSDDGVYKDVNGDCMASYLDAVIFLFKKGDSNPVALNDDDQTGKGTADGSISSRDPYISTFLEAGSYVLAVAAVPTTASDAFKGVALLKDPPELYSCVSSSQSGAYRVQFQGSETITFPPSVRASSVPAACDLSAASICAI